MATNSDRAKRLQVGAVGLLVVVGLLSLLIGRYPVPVSEIFSGLTHDAGLVLFQIRAPRLVAGILVGAGLSVAGAAFQGLFRNPMASPDILGASAGAGFGAAVALFLGAGYALVSAGAFVSGLIAVAITSVIGQRARLNETLGLVLAGIMVSSLFNAGTSYVKLVADPDNVLPAITFWLMGSLADVRWHQLAWAAGPVVGGMAALLVLRWKLNILTMGEDEARTMGVDTRVMRFLIVGFATLITAACVAISGLIGWVGLVIPHLARLSVGNDNRVMMPFAMLTGASFVLLVDDLARAVTTSEIPIGILTAFVGAPFFVYLMLGRGSRL